MYNQVVLVWIVGVLIQSGKVQNAQENAVTTTGYDLILSKIESRLNLASKIVETARKNLRNDIRQICHNSTCSPASVDCNKWKRSYPDAKPMDCGDIYNDGFTTSGVYQIWPKTRPSNEPLLVYCDMEDGGGWTVIQRRGIFGNPDDYFFQDWNAYKAGFGHLLREFWIGNDNLFTLTNQRSYQLKVDLTSFDDVNSTKYATYSEFWVDDLLHNYTLHLGEYEGTAGNSMRWENRMKFSTYDRGVCKRQGVNCGDIFKGAWWYTPRPDSNLNGLHLKGDNVTRHQGIVWSTFKDAGYSLKGSVMKIRANKFP